uniref:CSON007946 protein n=1 Tax=Culicoides sonorensis TaxID=179676 RepID=A0A336LKH9_CULSO
MNIFGLFITLFVAVHNSGVISGQFMNSGAVKCGSHICRPITGIFTKNPLPNGYVNVATIPAGASNISITELKNSVNFLVLKTRDNRFVINGDYTVSLSGQYEAAGTTFDYRRIDGLTNSSGQSAERHIEGVTEWITCNGPTTEVVQLMVLSQVHNPGIKYEYLIPVQPTSMTTSEEDIGANELSSSEIDSTNIKHKNVKSGDISTQRSISVPKRRRFLWKVVGFSQCSKTCGGGTQTPIIKCVRESPQRIFNPKRCAHLKQPVLNENQMRCNNQPCPAYWKLSEWTDCRCGEFNEEEYKSREVKCVQELMSGIVIQVKHGACIDDEPPARQKCECNTSPKNRRQRPSIINRAHNDENNNKIQGRPGRNRQKIHEVRKHGSWLTAPWSKDCSSVCGMGVQYRSIFCERNTSPNAERCDLRLTPDTTRECSSNEKCAFGEWFVGPWSKCSGDCFNLTKGRSIVCIKDDGFAADEDCNEAEKPKSEEKCQMHEVDYCRPRWHYSEWSECSKKCGDGTQRRIVKCLEPNEAEGQMKESSNCKYSDRELAYKTCNVQDCQETSRSSTTEPPAALYDPRVDMIQNDSNCVDDFPNCHLVVKAKLCDYKYYLDHCCSSCRLKTDELY